MGRTVGELLETCSYPELVEWGEYYSLEPFGEWRADVRTGIVASVIANSNRDATRRPEPFVIDDFMLFNKRRPEMESSQDGATVDPALIGWLFSRAGASVH